MKRKNWSDITCQKSRGKRKQIGPGDKNKKKK